MSNTYFDPQPDSVLLHKVMTANRESSPVGELRGITSENQRVKSVFLCNDDDVIFMHFIGLSLSLSFFDVFLSCFRLFLFFSLSIHLYLGSLTYCFCLLHILSVFVRVPQLKKGHI